MNITEYASPIDELEHMRAIFGNDFAELAALFQGDSVKRIQALYVAVAEGNQETIIHIAHVLSGSAASMGVTGMAALCKNLETQARAGMKDNLQSGVDAIAATYATIDARLQVMFQ